MKCLFCGEDMWTEENSLLIKSYWCHNLFCMINNDFPRYVCVTDEAGNISAQEFATPAFYAKVNDYGTTIYRLVHCFLMQTTSIPEPLWLNPTNFESTLDKVRAMHYIMWNG